MIREAGPLGRSGSSGTGEPLKGLLSEPRERTRRSIVPNRDGDEGLLSRGELSGEGPDGSICGREGDKESRLNSAYESMLLVSWCIAGLLGKCVQLKDIGHMGVYRAALITHPPERYSAVDRAAPSLV
jgi:hypothetical protein